MKRYYLNHGQFTKGTLVSLTLKGEAWVVGCTLQNGVREASCHLKDGMVYLLLATPSAINIKNPTKKAGLIFLSTLLLSDQKIYNIDFLCRVLENVNPLEEIFLLRSK